MSLEKLTTGGRLRMRTLQFHLHANWSRLQGMHIRIMPSEECHKDLDWWGDLSNLFGKRSLRKLNPDWTLFTDASTSGWGGTIQDKEAAGTWSEEEKTLHINVLELRAVRLSLLAFQHLVKDKTVPLRVDNATAMSYIRKGVSVR